MVRADDAQYVNGQDLVKGIFEDFVQALEAEDAMSAIATMPRRLYFDKKN